jgi:acetyl esterase
MYQDSNPRRPNVAVRILSGVAATWTVIVFLIVAGVLLPRLPVLGAFATLFESFFSVHIAIAAIIGLLLALSGRHYGAGRLAAVTVVLALAATLGAIVPIIAMARAADRYGANISWADHLHATARFKAAPPDQTVLYTTVDGKSLYADVYLPLNPSSQTSAPVLMMHGGGYIGGHRSMARTWNRWFTARGYTVFDIDYRLAPPPTWNQAAQDAACAMTWISTHANDYRIDPQRMLVAGQSAGGGLALQLAYGLDDGTVKSSCGGTPPRPKAVFALYPPDDFILGWNMNTGIGPASGRRFSRMYVGGSPDEYPDRYRAVSAVFHVRPGLPPMLIASGDSDHLVPFAGHLELVAELNHTGVANQLVAIPYNEHAYDLIWGSLGAQITRRALERFLVQYLPPTESR